MASLASLAGPLAGLLLDPTIGEVVVNGPYDVWVEVDGRMRRVDTRFRDALELRQTAVRLVAACGRRIDDATPMVDARLPDGSRVNVVLPPIAVDGALITIRRFGASPLRFDDLIARGAISSDDALRIRGFVDDRRNVLISGGQDGHNQEDRQGWNILQNSLPRLVCRLRTGQEPARRNADHGRPAAWRPVLRRRGSGSGLRHPNGAFTDRTRYATRSINHRDHWLRRAIRMRCLRVDRRPILALCPVGALDLVK